MQITFKTSCHKLPRHRNQVKVPPPTPAFSAPLLQPRSLSFSEYQIAQWSIGVVKNGICRKIVKYFSETLLISNKVKDFNLFDCDALKLNLLKIRIFCSFKTFTKYRLATNTQLVSQPVLKENIISNFLFKYLHNTSWHTLIQLTV